MKLDLSTYSFRPAAIDDLPRLRRWLHAPEVRRWWGNPSEQFELLRADLDEPRMTMRLVSLNGRPFAYAQDYEVHAWPQPHLAHLPQGSRAIDSFIGWPSMIGRGHGQAYLRLLASGFVSKARHSPQSIQRSITSARRAYEKAGFRLAGLAATDAGPAVLMLYEPEPQRISSASPRRP